MHAMIRTAPPQVGQVSTSMPRTRFRRCAQVIAARRSAGVGSSGPSVVQCRPSLPRLTRVTPLTEAERAKNRTIIKASSRPGALSGLPRSVVLKALIARSAEDSNQVGNRQPTLLLVVCNGAPVHRLGPPNRGSRLKSPQPP